MRIPKSLREKLISYLNEDEKVEDIIKEVFIPKFDFRWVILTQKRVIVVVRKFLDYTFKDYSCSLLDLDLSLGSIFDEIEFEVPGKNYKAQFYSFRRDATMSFFRKASICLSMQSKKEEVECPDPEVIKQVHILREAKRLKDEGIITNEEFERKRDEVLRRL